MSGPDKWGPHGWKFIHYITMGYPDRPTSEHKNRYKKFFFNLTGVIPCVLCRNNYIKHLKEYPMNDKVLKNKKNLMAWGVLMHNLVNKSNNKPEVPIEKGIQMIYQNDDTCSVEKFGVIESKRRTNLKKVVYISPVILFGIILIYQLIKVYCKMKK
jgi:hypothetical protein